ncbi:unnamed protein product [Acanthoscelides obtectus]|uniref:Uncharacterized protein n=1 Tax=Acanthoscelides obtectus TaxID=200917 RepID=A0A9P0P8I5_ACAOB|nr:unnamed protein product [Acanthoscelides obtectus]CAK1647612.1 hypothetical protein AOBTE_LOCUS15293 [Acanthoscelides obtectus]
MLSAKFDFLRPSSPLEMPKRKGDKHVSRSLKKARKDRKYKEDIEQVIIQLFIRHEPHPLSPSLTLAVGKLCGKPFT